MLALLLVCSAYILGRILPSGSHYQETQASVKVLDKDPFLITGVEGYRIGDQLPVSERLTTDQDGPGLSILDSSYTNIPPFTSVFISADSNRIVYRVWLTNFHCDDAYDAANAIKRALKEKYSSLRSVVMDGEITYYDRNRSLSFSYDYTRNNLSLTYQDDEASRRLFLESKAEKERHLAAPLKSL